MIATDDLVHSLLLLGWERADRDHMERDFSFDSKMYSEKGRVRVGLTDNINLFDTRGEEGYYPCIFFQVTSWREQDRTWVERPLRKWEGLGPDYTVCWSTEVPKFPCHDLVPDLLATMITSAFNGYFEEGS